MLPKILLVDDSEIIHALVRVYFADEKVELHSALNGEAAVALSERIAPDLLLLDADMPGMSDFSDWRKLRENNVDGPTPAIFMTATVESFRRVHRLKSDLSDYIAKPFDVELLLAKVRATIAKHRRERKTTAKCGSASTRHRIC